MNPQIEALRADLGRLRGDLPAIAYAAGVSYTTLSHILRGIQTNPTLRTYLALRAAVDERLQTAASHA